MRIAAPALKIFLLGATSSIALSANTPSLIGPLTDTRIADGCGWSAAIKSQNDPLIFFAELNDAVVRMNIAGIDVDLHVISESGRLEKRGDVLRKVYTADGIEVIGTYTVTWDCSQSDNEDCEVTDYDVTFEVKKGSETQVIKAVGDVGC
jgi:hypothetical protein